jgi:predicted transposase/invertase (TIGR01784 family)
LTRQVSCPWELPGDEERIVEELEQGKVNRWLDSVFKFIFCKEERIPIFLDLINALIYLKGEDDGETVNLEMQASVDPDYLKRVVIYTSWVHSGQLDRGKKYYEARPTISVNILGFDQFEGDKSFCSSFSFRNDKSGKKLNNDLQLFFFEIPKFLRNVKMPKTKQERWMAYLAGIGGGKMERIASQEPMISDALVAERFFTMDRETRLAYMMEWKHIMDEEARESRCREAEAKYVRAEERRKEAEMKVEITRKFLANGASIDLIAQSTGLSLEEIQRLTK